MKIGRQIKNLRQAKNVKQEELAEYLGVSFQAVSKWETGASVPDIALLPGLAVFFGVTIDELFKIPNEAEFERIENMFWQERRIAPETFERAVIFLQNVLKDEPDNVRAYSCLAYLYNHRAHSDHETAGGYAKKALELDPDGKDGWVAFLEANNGVCGDEWYDNHFEVINYFAEFLEKNPGNYGALYAIIENLLADDRFDEAVPYIEQLRRVIENGQYEVYMSDVMFGKGEVEKGLEYLNRAVANFPNRWQGYCDRADRFRKLGRYEEALADYEKCFVMQETPRIWDGLASMAQVHEQLGELDEAMEDRRRIIKCLKEEHHTTSGESVEMHRREIERLKRKKEKA